MLLLGNYPFTTRVFNLFGPATGVRLKISVRHHPCYYDDNNFFIAEPITPPSDQVQLDCPDYVIEPGRSLAFPMYFGDESLVISMDASGKIPVKDYYLSTGAKAKTIVTELNEPMAGTSFGKIEENNETFYVGGTWAIAANNTAWTLTIKKYGPDPEDDDVTVGPGTPG